jgi:hypothetical protein
MRPLPLLFVTAVFLLADRGFSQAPVTSPSQSPLWLVPDDPSLTTSGPCPIFRKLIFLDEQPVACSARVIGLGHFAFTVNGRHPGESLVNQPWSQYNRTLYWQEFDLGSLLQKGENVLGVQLGNSFWCVGPANDTGRYLKTDAMPDFSAGHPYLLWLEARITLQSGKELTVTSDTSWKWTRGLLTFSHIYAGEDFDARCTPVGWGMPGFNDQNWRPVALASTPAASREHRMAENPHRAQSRGSRFGFRIVRESRRHHRRGVEAIPRNLYHEGDNSQGCERRSASSRWVSECVATRDNEVDRQEIV